MKKSIHGLYAITDPNLSPAYSVINDVEAALKGGARMIQFRDKTTDWDTQLKLAIELKALCEQYQATFIINDNIELTKASKADGIHLGKNDDSLEIARQQLGENAIIGISCYNSPDRALEMQQRGANYAAFGRFFASKTKPQAPQADLLTLTEAKKVLEIPVVAIGGIDESNATPLIDAGADSVAVIQGVFAQPDIERAAKQLQFLFEK